MIPSAQDGRRQYRKWQEEERETLAAVYGEEVADTLCDWVFSGGGETGDLYEEYICRAMQLDDWERFRLKSTEARLIRGRDRWVVDITKASIDSGDWAHPLSI